MCPSLQKKKKKEETVIQHPQQQGAWLGRTPVCFNPMKYTMNKKPGDPIHQGYEISQLQPGLTNYPAGDMKNLSNFQPKIIRKLLNPMGRPSHPQQCLTGKKKLGWRNDIMPSCITIEEQELTKYGSLFAMSFASISLLRIICRNSPHPWLNPSNRTEGQEPIRTSGCGTTDATTNKIQRDRKIKHSEAQQLVYRGKYCFSCITFCWRW